MTKITNTGKRRLGLAGRPSLVLDAGQTAEVTQEQYRSFLENMVVSRWFASGLIAVDGEAEAVTQLPELEKPEVAEGIEHLDPGLPEGVKGAGVELYHAGSGWWAVYVNGFLVTDVKVRKAEAEAIAKDYR